MNEDIKRLVDAEGYRVRFVGAPAGGLQAVQVNGSYLPVGVVARLISKRLRLASLTTKETT